MKPSAAVGILLACGLMAGCYSRQPLAQPQPSPEARVVVVVTDQGAATMADQIGSGAVEVEGVVRWASADEWALHLTRVLHRDGRQVAWNRELISFPAGTLGETQVVVLDRRRSWLAAGAGVVGVFVAGRILGVTLTGEDEGRGPTGPVPPELTGRPRR
jgi:hypothetical protein